MLFLKTVFLKSLAIVGTVTLISSCSQETHYKKIIGSTMGTNYSVIAKISHQNINQIHQEIETELNDINQLMSTYISDSEINRFNQLQDNTCFTFSDKTWQVLLASKQVYEETNGAFDITLGPLISRWGFNVEQYAEKVPTPQEIAQLLTQVGTNKLSYDLDQQCIQKTRPDITINLSAIAKGYGVDRLATIVEQHHISDYLVEIGGEVKASGLKNFNQNWKIAVEKPSTAGQRQQSIIVNLLDSSIATSGDYRNYFVHQGKRFSHTIDPTNGYPVTHQLTSISVIHPSNMMADAYATALNVLGTKQAYEFAKKHQLAIYTISQNGAKVEVDSNRRFKDYISQ
ncbi:FAD:protein FMN transferase [Kangiella sp. TOML190]|uniref:FAD:protein FMN transferase n=1 Tax=Kangiella sp. TOML190 TaxID=2931351 RepID=UPI002040409E|nr:FAD:protein FMN transferase [Kangiella sp. TOML190]